VSSLFSVRCSLDVRRDASLTGGHGNGARFVGPAVVRKAVAINSLRLDATITFWLALIPSNATLAGISRETLLVSLDREP
jgi:hypothetical protein